MAFHPYLPLAAFGDLVEAIVPLIMMVLWAASHLIGAKPKAKPQVRPRPAPPQLNPMNQANPMAPPAALGGPAGQGGKPTTLEESLRREVEEFMRRAQGRPQPPAQQAQRKPTGGGRPTTPPGPPRRDNRPNKPMVSQPQPTVRRLTDAPGAQTTAQAPQPSRSMTAGAPGGSRVAEAVAQDLAGVQALATHAQQLGKDVAQADERMQEHLQEKFTHQIGALQHTDDQKGKRAVRSPVAQELFNLLARPGGMKQIIIASEILRRPVDRWEAPAGRDGSLRG